MGNFSEVGHPSLRLRSDVGVTRPQCWSIRGLPPFLLSSIVAVWRLPGFNSSLTRSAMDAIPCCRCHGLERGSAECDIDQDGGKEASARSRLGWPSAGTKTFNVHQPTRKVRPRAKMPASDWLFLTSVLHNAATFLTLTHVSVHLTKRRRRPAHAD